MTEDRNTSSPPNADTAAQGPVAPTEAAVAPVKNAVIEAGDAVRGKLTDAGQDIEDESELANTAIRTFLHHVEASGEAAYANAATVLKKALADLEAFVHNENPL